MQQHIQIIAQRLLNLYRQEHVINGGWATVNKIFIQESNDPSVIAELENLPTGKNLVKHINNLRSGKTPMDSIDNELLPYGGMMLGQESNLFLTKQELTTLKNALDKFEPTLDGLKTIQQLPFVNKLGNNWIESIKSILLHDADMLSKWNIVARTDKAYQIWNAAKYLVSETLTERDRAHIQADMPDFETYLPMFDEQGNQMLEKLRTFISSTSNQ